ncbi:tRNA (N6-threonylcarbamoyladenosine(37)-N6)-methyltransferase TrmO [Vibrio fluvialis]|jgi:tRNA-Thr(GGU) m(6)t(6)A37 methyltransferase TsaA|uniref:tRNA (N6-threonylcarbamoyladenosine(37)-N6)-methyltransferase TrmO n=1 Tax=Vibrio fluvialis TaxID=676 RepID=UPI0004115DE0|nr:tRNA (N6-threonylcarbamoyladenosine(37)-N6)-methyltransferase TrmO [Vibrio fluvialis]EKO3383474.1 tRNA (N6-threonylcarbamoyladenosine(37)-N6)-methyltransferase TrmO [Vibrio fluvialis]EKO3406764.1 tRNA (N6-threonylcarbamoyladenosine(37)-N6)-methyltransferase TrmO [Vibrio fluvialis]EKO3462886.1 tRNA (N6-threonylcarbamoyladenosine(37)-N6)-methyltransferase TrmO [Vibrio fluvialis]EKO3503864.1 tRNA (N6-threonylcarbamoyladenosine(37)-N6)-methyltransferase TrmO [Vibrio fluvialis]ELO4019982.1 tRNA 
MHTIEPIAVIESPYKEKFAVPRQPRLVPSATARVKLLGESNCPEAVRGIEQFSHLWLLFLFDQNLQAGWKPTVRPPRLGGNERIGVLASRSTFRPNGIGMSAVELRGVSKQGDQIYLDLGSVDLVDGTPIIDIKPYIPYSDSIADAQGGYAEAEPEQAAVTFSAAALETLQRLPDGQVQQAVIGEVLAQDPRPAYKKNKPDMKEYAVNLYDLNVKFMVNGNLVTVTAIERF